MSEQPKGQIFIFCQWCARSTVHLFLPDQSDAGAGEPGGGIAAEEGDAFRKIMTSIPVSFHTSGSDLVTSHKLSKVSPGQAKRLNRKLLRKNLGTVESRAGGWVGDIILLELVQKMCSSKKPLCIRCSSAPAAKGTASQVSQTQRLQQLKLLTAFLPVSPQSRGANPTGCPSSTLGDYKCPQSSPLQFPYQRSHFALWLWQAGPGSTAGRLYPQATCSSGGGKLNICAGKENSAVLEGCLRMKGK